MKKVALISSFCDTEEKLLVLNKNIVLIKDLGIDVILISPIFIPESTTSLCDYYFQTKDNVILDWPVKSMFAWRDIYIGNVKYKMTKTYGDYGWAGLCQVKQLSEIALSFNYDQYYHMIYDLKIDDNVLEGFKSDKVCNIYPSTRFGKIWKVGLHFMIFDKTNLKRFINNIHLDSYLNLQCSDAFEWLEMIHKVFPYKFETTPVEDEIYLYENHDFFNCSPIKELPFFIIKDDEILDNIKLFFYSVKELKPIKLIINDNDVEYLISDYKIIDLGFTKFNIKEVKLIYMDIEYDITEIISKIKHNTLRVQ